MVGIAFIVGLVIGLVLWIGILLSAAGVIRFWPAGESTWQSSLHWGLVVAFDIAAILTVIRTWNSWSLPRHPVVLLVGLLFVMLGVAIAIAAGRTLAPGEAMDQSGELRTRGLYARTRNPMYLGLILSLIGAILLVNSLAVTILLSLNIGWILSRPFAEERALRETHGAAYQTYTERVPRFVGRRSLVGSHGNLESDDTE